MFRTTFALLGAMGLAKGVPQNTTGIAMSESAGNPTVLPTIPTVIQEAMAAGTPTFSKDASDPTAQSILEEIRALTSQQNEQERPTDVASEEDIPRNPKKRMWEEKVDEERKQEL
jgi:protein transport protein SEC20